MNTRSVKEKAKVLQIIGEWSCFPIQWRVVVSQSRAPLQLRTEVSEGITRRHLHFRRLSIELAISEVSCFPQKSITPILLPITHVAELIDIVFFNAHFQAMYRALVLWMEILLHIVGYVEFHCVARYRVLGRVLQVVSRLGYEQGWHHADEDEDYDREDLHDDGGGGLRLATRLLCTTGGKVTGEGASLVCRVGMRPICWEEHVEDILRCQIWLKTKLMIVGIAGLLTTAVTDSLFISVQVICLALLWIS